MTGRLSVRAVVEAVSGITGVPVADIVGPRRTLKLVRTRQIAMYYAKRYCPHLTYQEIGRRMGARDHTTIIHGVRKIEADIAAQGSDATMAAVEAVLAPALDVVQRLDIAEPDLDPQAIAERAMDGHAIARLSYGEIRILAEFALHVIAAGQLVTGPPELDPDQPSEALILAARRAVIAHRDFETARYGHGERSAADALRAAIKDLHATYAEIAGAVIAPARPAFKAFSNAHRKEANHG
jgi:hypothetical protein